MCDWSQEFDDGRVSCSGSQNDGGIAFLVFIMTGVPSMQNFNDGEMAMFNG